MIIDRQDKKNNFLKISYLNRAPFLSLLVLLSGILFANHPSLIRESWASNGKIRTYLSRAEAARSYTGVDKTAPDEDSCVLSGIFYEEDNPRVLINEDLLSLNSYCCGGKIVSIFVDFIVLEFPDHKRKEYKLGDVIRREEIKVEPTKPTPTAPPKVESTYMNKMSSLLEPFMASHNQNNAALDMRMKKSLFTDQSKASQIQVRASRMLELIQEKKQDVASLSAPENCKRHYYLTIKLFDIAEDGWKAVLADSKDKAEVFFGRLAKVFEEISRESLSILSRQ